MKIKYLISTLKEIVKSNLIAFIPFSFFKYFLPSKIIFYAHSISDDFTIVNNRYLTPTQNEFEEFILKLRKLGYDFTNLTSFLESGNKSILITFDDGLKEIYSTVYPLLTRLRVPFVVFINTAYLSNDKFVFTELKPYHDGVSRIYLTIKEIEILKANNVTIGFHSNSHKTPKEYFSDFNIFCTDVQIPDEFKYLFTIPLNFAYPFHAPEKYIHFDEYLIKIGMKNIFDTKGKFTHSGNHFFRIPVDVKLGFKKGNKLFYNLKYYTFYHYFSKIKEFLSLGPRN